ncbi:MAG: hypothetical protein COU68_00300 [Candidatus Pacebacteria bacterium CG10_big_fil_rev_8_21_14_0_10_45_6]|nr:MAG: hypothetical protein COU68_00300 [Candidatus Pacebacteria bacterium CG10_big_fil_rev_8_21_14_0_10_45_6]
MSKQYWLTRHHSFLTTLTKKMRWPHEKTKPHKTLRAVLTICLYAAHILLGYMLAQLQHIAQ